MSRMQRHDWHARRSRRGMRTATIQSRRLRFEPLEDRRMLAVITVMNDLDLGGGSLRQAILDANGSIGVPDEIVFDASLLGGTIRLDAQLPTITDELTITGPGANLLTIDAQLGGDGLANGNGWRIFNIDDGAASLVNVAISGLTLTGGDESSDGGAILTRENLTLTNAILTGNRAFHGGGIYNAGGTTEIANSTLSGNTGNSRGGGVYSKSITNVTGSTLSDNHATYGGGIYNAGSGALGVANSTLSGNFAENAGGGIDNYGTADISHSTVTENGTYLFGAGIRGYGTTTLDHTIVSGNLQDGSPSNLYGGSFSGDYNLVGTDSSISGSGNISSDSPGLGPLASNGGSTQTHALLTGSPAIDAGGSAALANDQRGAPFLRVFDDPVAPGSGVDIGAYERQTSAAAFFVVTTASDELNYSNAEVSLREAINTANGSVGADTITFGALFNGAQTIALASQLPAITEELTVTGPGQGWLTIDAGNGVDDTINTGDGFRVFLVDDGFSGNQINVTLTGMTLTGGDSRDSGGAIFSAENLTIQTTTIVGSASGGSSSKGGGVFISSLGELTISDSTISGNRATLGGGIYNAGTANITNSTLSGNVSNGGKGGGFYNGGTAHFMGSTLADNTAQNYGGGIFNVGMADFNSGTLSGNSASQGGGIHNDGTLDVVSSNLVGNSFGDLGGGIRNDGTANIVDSTLTGNTGGIRGGGIGNSGTLSVTDSTISGNMTSEAGGGIHNSNVATITGSTISDNMALFGGGGGIASASGTVTVISSTLSGNSAGFRGGAIDYNLGAVHIARSTISGNSAVILGGAIASSSDGTSSINNSIVSGNDVGGVPFNLAISTSGSYNLVGFGSTPLGTGNIISYAPQLGPLADHGGPTMTHALLPGSLAIDAGDPNFDPDDPDGNPMTDDAMPYDQRGAPFVRVYDGDGAGGARIDIGAFERQPNPLPGDYNFDGKVSAADYTTWRNTLDSTNDLRADGDENGQITQNDYQVWKNNYGNTLPPPGTGAASEEVAVAAAVLLAEPLPPTPPARETYGTEPEVMRADVTLADAERIAWDISWTSRATGDYRRPAASARSVLAGAIDNGPIRDRALLMWSETRWLQGSVAADDGVVATRRQSSIADDNDPRATLFPAIDAAFGELLPSAAAILP